MSFNISVYQDFAGGLSQFYGVTSLCVLKGRSSHFPAHCQSVSFVVWPYINNVKVMISRLKAPVLSCCLAPPPHPPRAHTLWASGAAKRESLTVGVGEVEEFLSHWGKVEGSKESFWENISSPSSPSRFSLPLKFARNRMMDRELALCPPTSSPLPLPFLLLLPQTLERSVLAGDGWGSGSVAATEDTQKLHSHIFICFHVQILIYVCLRCQLLNIVSLKHCFIKYGVSFLKVQALQTSVKLLRLFWSLFQNEFLRLP